MYITLVQSLFYLYILPSVFQHFMHNAYETKAKYAFAKKSQSSCMSYPGLEDHHCRIRPSLVGTVFAVSSWNCSKLKTREKGNSRYKIILHSSWCNWNPFLGQLRMMNILKYFSVGLLKLIWVLRNIKYILAILSTMEGRGCKSSDNFWNKNL